MSARLLIPAAICAALTALAVTISMPAPLTALLILALVVGPAVTAWFASRGLDAMSFVAAGMLAAAAVALVGAIDNEVGNDDYQVGLVFVGTLFVGLLFTLPPVLILALLRRD
ncbi:MAG: hypothetical protein AB7L91_09765 [Dehalococcoidia bacterium]